jgi:hypothetical protein
MALKIAGPALLDNLMSFIIIIGAGSRFQRSGRAKVCGYQQTLCFELGRPLRVPHKTQT